MDQVHQQTQFLFPLVTDNQWSCFSAGVTWSGRWRLCIRRAAAFWTGCNVQQFRAAALLQSVTIV